MFSKINILCKVFVVGFCGEISWKEKKVLMSGHNKFKNATL